MVTSNSSASEAASLFQSRLMNLLSKERGIASTTFDSHTPVSIAEVLLFASQSLRTASKLEEADALDSVYDRVTLQASFGGLALSDDAVPTTSQFDETLFLCEAWLERIKSKERSRDFLVTNRERAEAIRPMTLAQKIFTQHALNSPEAAGGLAVGDVVRVGADWILASELSWSGMAQTYEAMKSPGIYRNDRL